MKPHTTNPPKIYLLTIGGSRPVVCITSERAGDAAPECIDISALKIKKNIIVVFKEITLTLHLIVS